jgi:hypothetical protein
MEPTSSTISAGLVFGTVALSTLIPGVNGDALIGAFAGAVVFTLHTKDLIVIKRLVYLIVSFVIGYIATPEVMHWTGVQSYGVAAFIASATVVTLALAFIEKIKAFDLSNLRKGD